MHKVWFGVAGVALAAFIAGPAPAQDYQRNFVECAKELGLQPDMQTQKFSDGRVLHTWNLYNEHQQATFNDCVARKASLAQRPSAKGRASPR
jgi:hypothetical protein